MAEQFETDIFICLDKARSIAEKETKIQREGEDDKEQSVSAGYPAGRNNRG